MLDRNVVMYIIIFTSHESLWEVLVPSKKRHPNKAESLREQGNLNPRPHTVKSELFLDSNFFDPRDLVQVKYEMLRRAQVERHPISQAAETFGFSRQTFYQAQVAFERSGLAGLIPRKRGPRGAHKLTPEVVTFSEQCRAEDESLGTGELAKLIMESFGVSIHPRTIERGLSRRKKT
jgi:transposase